MITEEKKPRTEPSIDPDELRREWRGECKVGNPDDRPEKVKGVKASE